MNSLIWQSVMWRPGKGRFLIGVKNPLPIRPATTARRRASFGGTPIAGFATSVGLPPPAVTHPATLSHPDCRAPLTLFAAPQPSGTRQQPGRASLAWRRDRPQELSV